MSIDSITRRRINLDEGDVHRGDPSLRIVDTEEQPARRHAPLPPKPQYKRQRTYGQRANDEMRKDIGLMRELEDYAKACDAEAARARAAIKCLEVRG